MANSPVAHLRYWLGLVMPGRTDGAVAGYVSVVDPATGNPVNPAAPTPAMATSGTATVLTQVAASATAVQLRTAQSGRKGFIVANTDTNPMLLKYGTGASATSFTFSVPANTTWVMPEPIYTGAITAIWPTAGAGAAGVTELT